MAPIRRIDVTAAVRPIAAPADGTCVRRPRARFAPRDPHRASHEYIGDGVAVVVEAASEHVDEEHVRALAECLGRLHRKPPSRWIPDGLGARTEHPTA